MEIKKVSILVPVYGVEKYIERCARSLFEQTYDNIEYIFVDDCTKDRSIEILQKVLEDYPNRKNQVKILHHEKNRGLSAARNTALDASTGDYLMHVDSDDYLRKDAVLLLAEKITTASSQVIIFGYSIVTVKKIYPVKLYPENKVSLICDYLLNRKPASMWNKFYDADFYKSSGIRSVEGINQGEDYVVMPRILDKAEKIEWLNECLYYYEQSNAQSYSNNIREDSIIQMKKADDILYGYFSKCSDKYKYAYALNNLYIRSALFFVKAGDSSVYSKVRNNYSISWKNLKTLSVTDKILVFFLVTKFDFLLRLISLTFKYIR